MITQALDLKVFLAPRAAELSCAYYDDTLDQVHQNLSRNLSISLDVSYEVIPAVLDQQWMVGADEQAFDDRITSVVMMYEKKIRNPEGLACVAADIDLGPYCGAAISGHPLIVVDPHSPRLAATILHELGHACGIKGHVDNKTSLMYACLGETTPDADWDSVSLATLSQGLTRYVRHY